MANILIKEDGYKFETDSIVKSVTVFTDRAEVTRLKRVKIKTGISQITFSNLGVNIDPESIRSMIESDCVRIISSSMESNNLYVFKEEENRKLFDEIVNSLKEYIKMEDQREISSLENNVIFDLRDYLQISLNDLILDSDASLTKLREALAFLNEKLNENSNEVNSINEKMRIMRDEIELYKIELAKIRNMDKRIQNNIVVVIESTNECETEVEINYIIKGVDLRFSYDAYLDTEGSKIDISYYGEVRQSTGEVWNDCRFTLSTAVCDRDITIPLIYPITLSGYQEKREKNIKVTESVYKEMSEQNISLEVGMGTGGSLNKPVLETGVLLEKNGISHSFTIDKSALIPSDGQYHKLLILKNLPGCEIFFESVPEMMEYVYQKANIKNNLSVPLMAGIVMLYRNGSYVGRSVLKYIASDEDFSLSFGIDDDLRIKRIMHLDRYIEPATPFGKKQREYMYKYVINNYKNEDVLIRIRESIHKSEIKEIQVEVKEDTTEGYKINESSIVSWDKKVIKDLSKSCEILLHYVISSPKSFPLENI